MRSSEPGDDGGPYIAVLGLLTFVTSDRASMSEGRRKRKRPKGKWPCRPARDLGGQAVQGQLAAYVRRWSRTEGALALVAVLAFVAGTGAGALNAAVAAAAGPVRAVGLTWSPPEIVDRATAGQGTPAAVSCVNATFCMAVDDGGNAIVFNGRAWSHAVSIDRGQQFDGISCASSSFCAAVDSDGNAVLYDNGKWGRPADIDNGTQLNSVSCRARTFCIAVDTQGGALTYNGARWKGPVTIDAGGNLASVSCAAPTSCAAVNLNDDQISVYAASTVVYRDGKWDHNVMRSFGNGQSVSCATPSMCVVIDNGGDAAIYNGSTWSGGKVIDNGDMGSGIGNVDVETDAVSCPTSHFCVVVDSAGRVVGYNGHNWARPVTIVKGVPNVIDDVSCPSTRFCVAITGAGEALVGS
jgi:hypothetical protein